MRNDEDLVALANENFVASFTKLAEHCEGGEHRWAGGICAYVTGLPVSLFNGCVVAAPVTSAELDEALSWVGAHDVPRRLFVVEGLEETAAPVATAHGLVRDPVLYPGMVLEPLSEPPAAQAGVEVTRVGSDLDDFRGIFVAQGRDARLAEQMFPDSFLGDRDVEAFVGHLEGRPVGYSLAIRSRGVGGVYNVGTLPEARRRGVGTAVTWAAVDVARRADVDCAVLQSTEMALSMYEAMGFRTVVRYVVFAEPVTPIGQATPVPPSPQ